METAALLQNLDRCQRLGFHSLSWEPWKVHPNEGLRRAVNYGLEAEKPDCGVAASDFLMSLAADRGFETSQFEVFQLALHLSSLADLITWRLRGSGDPWRRPDDQPLGNTLWTSSSFLGANSTRLRRVALVDRWTKERELAETYSWKTLGETSVYNMPQTLTIVVIGVTRDGKHHSPWSRGYIHPRSKQLRVQRRDGESFGPTWQRMWREDRAELSRDKWLEAMEEDDVFAENLVQIEIPAPPSNLRQEMLDLISRNLDTLAQMKTAPGKAPSQCFWPSRCPLVHHCWYGQPLT